MSCLGSKIAIFGGSFNPFTNVHLDIVKNVLSEYLDYKVVVSIENPFKDNLISYTHRLNMADLALDIQPKDSFDFSRHLKRKYSGPLRTWHILEHIENNWQLGGRKIELIFGNDIKQEIDQFEKIDFIRKHASIRFLPETNIMHATDIRKMISENNPEWEKYVPFEVANYIKLHNLYSEK